MLWQIFGWARIHFGDNKQRVLHDKMKKKWNWSHGKEYHKPECDSGVEKQSCVAICVEFETQWKVESKKNYDKRYRDTNEW